jgi:hypothetical protein
MDNLWILLSVKFDKVTPSPGLGVPFPDPSLEHLSLNLGASAVVAGCRQAANADQRVPLQTSRQAGCEGMIGD